MPKTWIKSLYLFHKTIFKNKAEKLSSSLPSKWQTFEQKTSSGNGFVVLQNYKHSNRNYHQETIL